MTEQGASTDSASCGADEAAEKTVEVSAGTVEAWTTGDSDILDSDLLIALNDAQEKISRGASVRQVVRVVITK